MTKSCIEECVGGGQGTAGAVDSDMDAERWREVLLKGKRDRLRSGGAQRQETRDRGSRREGSAGRLLCRHTGAFSQTTGREERGGQEKEELEMQRLSLGYRLL